jgi:DnaK suppressor protein
MVDKRKKMNNIQPLQNESKLTGGDIMNENNILKKTHKNKIMRRTARKVSERGSNQSVFNREQDFRSEFLKTLELKREEINRAISRLIENQNGYDASLSADDSIEEIDRAAREIETQKRYGIVERKSDELKKIEFLIKRILKDEDFGLCEDCGRRIPERRLIVMPDATRCVSCQQKTEKWDSSRKSAIGKSPRRPNNMMSDWDEDDTEESVKRFFVDATGTPILVEDFEELNGLKDDSDNKDKDTRQESKSEQPNNIKTFSVKF